MEKTLNEVILKHLKLFSAIASLFAVISLLWAGYQWGSYNCQPQTKVEPVLGYTVLNADSVIQANGDTVKYDRRIHVRGKH